ncbi:tRNA U34 5-methylaminomethyl-2-thiouridine-forming methyltransferase MnmC [Christiangramia gaetbulicola]|uniref:tRNA U34 5-methylaminomethyl-2-thiouridine-forming methyltransferase MnmC n=1 Tax=Christiangramia gaetbulicola TaxID=703340 RepID=A0A2T6AJY6_9FLAO|nr:tRNA (5-methylaminomethyl-2-thiouridine)(34)-methyltransferase MnmD [Christiangramia gaetbulicola]PTX44135.1 tRNA U34 5-methylaminomethyl-2-thiouridine-forming methyltransferase MnmC [Christiangramia gaetbulicola]
MERKIIKTEDGSVTIHLPEWNEQYHSKHGAVQEARHVFLKMGLYHYIENFDPEEISILEIGFGTGLNAFLTLVEAERIDLKINYTGVEAYPVSAEEVLQLNYPEASQAEEWEVKFKEMHTIPWEERSEISKNFSLEKQQKKFDEIEDKALFDIIYFDAFGARVQPELWTEEIFSIMFKALKNNGVLVTYAAKGSVRRAMLATGFQVEKLPGPPGKREMLRAVKK